MIIDFFTGKEIKDNGKCKNCKWLQGYLKANPRIIWCDKHLTFKENNCSCEYYKFKCEEE